MADTVVGGLTFRLYQVPDERIHRSPDHGEIKRWTCGKRRDRSEGVKQKGKEGKR